MAPGAQALVGEALARLGVRRLLLSIHDASFPSAPEEELGRGSPYGRGAERFLGWVRGLGFTGIGLGPQGETTLVDPSPYDGSLFTHSVMSLAAVPLLEEEPWCRLGRAAEIVGPHVIGDGAGAARVQYRHAYRAAREIVAELHRRFEAAGHDLDPCREDLGRFRAETAAFLEPDGIFEALTEEHGTDDWRRWWDVDIRLYTPGPGQETEAGGRRAELRRKHPEVIARHLFAQWLLERQQGRLRRTATGLGLELYGDLQIGISQRDFWARRGLFMTDYRMGAPPSRTNPEGQPWGFPVFDPRQYFERGPDGERRPGPVLRFFKLRLSRLFAHFDGLRIDHPHGLVCPWVYRVKDPDPFHAVAHGARLFSSPALEEHPALGAFAIARREQVGGSAERYADDWERDLDAAQVEEYAVLFDVVIQEAMNRGGNTEDVMAEVLSTWPYPLRRVMERYKLGRFRITQKASLTDPHDPYRSENARPEDWIMVGNHDTKPLALLAEGWHGTDTGRARAEMLAARLVRQPEKREAFVRWAAQSPRHLCQAMYAELFASDAQNVAVFFADLFGMKEIYNRPGTVDDVNWTLRVPRDYEAAHAQGVRDGYAMNLPAALQMAMEARGVGGGEVTEGLERAGGRAG
jgi:4-alpha-glucanotransferase